MRLLAWSLSFFALLGFARVGRGVLKLASSQGAVRELLVGFGHPLVELIRSINYYDNRVTNSFLTTLVVVLVLRQISL